MLIDLAVKTNRPQNFKDLNPLKESKFKQNMSHSLFVSSFNY